MPHSHWRAIAAYIYTLGLDDLGIAWECLRRNPDYAAAFAGRFDGAEPGPWGLLAFEDPRLDARVAEPLWDSAAIDLLLVPTAAPVTTDTFDLWSLPSPRRLLHDGHVLRAMLGDARVRLAGTLRQGRPFAYQTPGGRAAGQRRRRADLTIAALEADGPRGRARRAKRDELARMNMFAAYDGYRAGAAHRDIAISLFGPERVALGWSADSELRARVRNYIARGRNLVGGGYRTLLAPG